MRVTIVGLTDMTISFSGIGLILRGKTEARNLEIKDDNQMRELIGMKNAKLISIENHEEKPPVFIMKDPEEIKIVLEEPIPPVPSLPLIKRGEVKTVEPKDGKKTIKRLSKAEDVKDSDEVVVMMDGKARKGRTKRSMVGDIEESEATRASLEAMKQLEDEENGEIEDAANVKPIDEESLPLNERMGNTATVAFGSRNTESVKMKNSILPEAEQTNQTNIANKFIPLKDKGLKDKEKARIKNAFIENKDIEVEPDETNDDNDDNDDLIET